MLDNFINRIFKKKSELAPIRDEQIWFDHPGARQKVLQDKNITEELRVFLLEFISKGYVVINGAISTDLCDQAVQEFQEWKKRNDEAVKTFRDPKGKLERIINFHQNLELFESLFTNNKSLALQDYLFKSETCLYTSLFFEQGTTQPIHRDIPLFWTNPSYHYFGVWVALEDVDETNGPLEVYEGGHMLSTIDRDRIAGQYFDDPSKIPAIHEDLWKSYQAEVVKLCEEKNLPKKQVHIKKGDTIVWHPLLPHGGAEILDYGRTRMSFVMHTTPYNVPVFHSNVFFNSKKEVKKSAPWGYRPTSNGRQIAESGNMSIGHGQSYDFGSLK